MTKHITYYIIMSERNPVPQSICVRYDCSCNMSNTHPSLNDCLEMGHPWWMTFVQFWLVFVFTNHRHWESFLTRATSYGWSRLYPLFMPVKPWESREWIWGILFQSSTIRIDHFHLSCWMLPYICTSSVNSETADDMYGVSIWQFNFSEYHRGKCATVFQES